MTQQANTDVRERVVSTLELIRPNLQADGGDVEFVDIDDQGVVTVRLQGACHGCPMAAMTLQMEIERMLKSKVPEVTGVESVQDE